MINTSEEYILCAAVHFKNGFKGSTTSNIKDGIVICGRRHSDCYNILEGLFEDINKIEAIDRDHQGFMTSKNRYVNRKEAYQIAVKAKQIEPRKPQKDQEKWTQVGLGTDNDEILISEDLY